MRGAVQTSGPRPFEVRLEAFRRTAYLAAAETQRDDAVIPAGDGGFGCVIRIGHDVRGVTELPHDGRHPIGNLVHGVVFAVGIVRPDHDHGGPGFEAVEIAVVEPPKDVLRAVAADA